MKKLVALSLIVVFIAACRGNENVDYNTDGTSNKAVNTIPPEDVKTNANPTHDPHRREGKFTQVEVGTSLDAAKADGRKKKYDVKCSGCHKITGEKLVGLGWPGVTSVILPNG